MASVAGTVIPNARTNLVRKDNIEHILDAINERIRECKHIIANTKKGLDGSGNPLKSDGGFIRTRETRDIMLLSLVRDLLSDRIQVMLSDEGMKGMDKLVFQLRRHIGSSLGDTNG